ncbi:MAG: glycosyltransferase family 4 protein [Desulfovibrionaceae bacterium]|nr:glycosyltransferase family 4 protein [Desulfovibrionaceae bacterium]
MLANLATKPNLACLLLWYPLFTQPFIFREVEGLKEILPTKVYTLYGQNLVHCSEEMLAVAKSVQTNGISSLPKVLLNLAQNFISKPKKFADLWTQTLKFKWPNLEILGENLWALAIAPILAQKLVQDKIDVIYAPWPRGTTTAAKVINHLTNIPYVTTVRGDNLAPADPDLGSKLTAATFIRANNLADLKRIEAFDKGQARGRVKLIYNSLTLKLAQDITPQIATYTKARSLKIMALGRFDVTKGFDVLISAIAILRDLGLNIHLTLAGGGGVSLGLGKLEGDLRRLVEKLNLTEIVSFPGLISHNELPNLLAAHDIFACPCVIDPSGRRDGIPNTVIEAMSAKLPIVSSNIHALPEVIQDQKTGLTVPPNDPKALANAIAWMANHPQEAARLGENAARHAQMLFDPKTNCQQLADLLTLAAQKSC